MPPETANGTVPSGQDIAIDAIRRWEKRTRDTSGAAVSKEEFLAHCVAVVTYVEDSLRADLPGYDINVRFSLAGNPERNGIEITIRHPAGIDAGADPAVLNEETRKILEAAGKLETKFDSSLVWTAAQGGGARLSFVEKDPSVLLTGLKANAPSEFRQLGLPPEAVPDRA